MTIGKQEYYEGAALHILVRGGYVREISYHAPFFIANGKLLLLIKYSTKGRTPWGFTFTVNEQKALRAADPSEVLIGLVCGHDGVAAVPLKEYLKIAPLSESAIHISCVRRHREHYEVSGPSGILTRRIAPSSWSHVLDKIEGDT